MADGIRKPWLLSYLISYAEQHGGQLSTLRPKQSKVQLINQFRTLPESLEEWVWADVSDKRHAIPVRFTMESVRIFNDEPRNAGRRLTSRRWGLAIIRCTRPLWCRPPTFDGKAQEENWTLALEVDHVEVAASEGEAMFGEPRDVTKEEPMRRWMEGLKDSNGPGGNVLKLERLERERQEKEANGARNDNSSSSHGQPLNPIFKRQSPVNEKLQEPDVRQRFRKWKIKMKDMGLVQAHVHHIIPEVQLRQLNEITVFGLGRSIIETSPVETQNAKNLIPGGIYLSPDVYIGTEAPSMPTSQPSRPLSPNVFSGGPTTPTQWGPSQISYVNEGQDDLQYHMDEPQVQDNLFSGGKRSDLEKNEAARKIQGIQGDIEDEMEVDDFLEPPLLLSLNPSPAGVMPSPMPASAEHPAPAAPLFTHGHTILAPDSDVSGTQSHTQSQSLTQRSLPSQLSALSQHILSRDATAKPSSDDVILEPPIPQEYKETTVRDNDGQADLENTELEADNEAAQRIPVLKNHQTSHLQNNSAISKEVTAQEQINQGMSRVLTPVQASGPWKSPLTSRSSHTKGVHGTKRISDDLTTAGAPPPSTQQGRRHVSDDVVLQRVEHSVDAWRSPSFANSKTRTAERGKRSTQEIYSPALIREGAKGSFAPSQGVDVETPEPHRTSLSPAAGQSTLRARCDDRTRQQRRNARIVKLDDTAATNSRQLSISSDHADCLAHSLKHEEVEGHYVSTGNDSIHAVETSSQRRRKLLRLGGWHPRKDVAARPHTMTWERFNKMLLKIGQSRVSDAQINP